VLSAAESGGLLNNMECWVAFLIVSTEPAAPLREAKDPCSAATGNDQSALEKRRRPPTKRAARAVRARRS
jgi:hypothetical protein